MIENFFIIRHYHNNLIGPFSSIERASRYAKSHYKDQVYTIQKPIKPKSGPLFWEIPSDTYDGLDYVVKLDENGEWSCGCKGFRFHGTDCKHIRKAKFEYSHEK